MEEFYISITRNTRVREVRKQLKINPNSDFKEILQAAGKKLGIEAKILYNRSGAIINNRNDIKSEETLYVSQGEEFWSRQSKSAQNIKESRTLTIGIIGHRAVGKSALTTRYIEKAYRDNFDPRIADTFTKEIEIKNKKVILNILDSSMLDEIMVSFSDWFEDGEGYIMLYSITDKDSFESFNYFYEHLATINKTDVPLVIVGNKCDMEEQRVIKKEDGMMLAKSFNAGFFEISVKKDINVTEMFEHLINRLYDIKYGAMRRENDVESTELKCKCNIL